MRERNHWYEKLIGRPEELEDETDGTSEEETERQHDRRALEDAQRLRIRNVHDLHRYC